MIRGNVNAGRQATIPIEIRVRDGLFHSLEAVIDTGFSGHLTLDPETIKLLDLRPMRSVDVMLAGKRLPGSSSLARPIANRPNS